MLAEKHGLHLWYIKILLEDHKKYLSALQYIEKLEYTEVNNVDIFLYLLKFNFIHD